MARIIAWSIVETGDVTTLRFLFAKKGVGGAMRCYVNTVGEIVLGSTVVLKPVSP